MILTKKNYFSLKNNYLSNSKIKDFMKDPDYFYKRHVTGEISFEPTPSMKIGSAVDLYLTGSAVKFRKTYQEKVLKKDNPDVYSTQQSIHPEYLLSSTEFAKVIGIVDSVKRTDIYKSIKKNYKSQKILQFPMKINKFFEGICGVEDWYKIEGNSCTIIDLKTTASIDERKFRYSCDDYAYYRQQSMYQTLFKLMYPNLTHFTSYILAVENIGPHYHSKMFKLNQEVIEFNKITIWEVIEELKQMKSIKDFKPYNLTWDDVIEL